MLGKRKGHQNTHSDDLSIKLLVSNLTAFNPIRLAVKSQWFKKLFEVIR